MLIFFRRGSSEIASFIDMIVKEVERLEDITKKYMGMVSYSKSKDDSENAVLPASVLEITKFVQGEMDQRKIDFIVETIPTVTLLFSHSSLKEVMLNLLKNAWEELGEKGTIKVRAELSGSSINIFIEDSGTGIRAQDRDKIFNIFYTNKAGGTGIGLSHSSKLIKESGGKIEVTDSKLGGAMFFISIPIKTNN